MTGYLICPSVCEALASAKEKIAAIRNNWIWLVFLAQKQVKTCLSCAETSKNLRPKVQL
jgi:hypothetical protein